MHHHTMPSQQKCATSGPIDNDDTIMFEGIKECVTLENKALSKCTFEWTVENQPLKLRVLYDAFRNGDLLLCPNRTVKINMVGAMNIVKSYQSGCLLSDPITIYIHRTFNPERTRYRVIGGNHRIYALMAFFMNQVPVRIECEEVCHPGEILDDGRMVYKYKDAKAMQGKFIVDCDPKASEPHQLFTVCDPPTETTDYQGHGAFGCIGKNHGETS
jgi:hypothetical protein